MSKPTQNMAYQTGANAGPLSIVEEELKRHRNRNDDAYYRFAPQTGSYSKASYESQTIQAKSRSMKANQREALLKTLKARFESNMSRHKGLDWAKVQAKLEASPDKLRSLNEMESTGGEPDVVGQDRKTGEYLFYDCSAESPQGRRSICYDRKALDARKENKPKDTALDMATAMGVELLTEAQYRELQTLGHFDAKTSSWIVTPPDIRQRGGAIFADYRYGHVFVYHNGADSYYAARGFRGAVRIQDAG